MRLIPHSHPIPAGIEHDRFRMRVITVDDLVADYDAVMSSAERLRERFPYWGWPDPAMTLTDDLVDLGWHQKEAQLRRSFNYAVLAPTAAGCSAASTSTRPRSSGPTPRSASGSGPTRKPATSRRSSRRRSGNGSPPNGRSRRSAGRAGRSPGTSGTRSRTPRPPAWRTGVVRCLCNAASMAGDEGVTQPDKSRRAVRIRTADDRPARGPGLRRDRRRHPDRAARAGPRRGPRPARRCRPGLDRARDRLRGRSRSPPTSSCSRRSSAAG